MSAPPRPTLVCPPPRATLAVSRMESGDIVIVQRKLSPAEAEGCRFPTVDRFLEYTRNRWGVRGRSHKCGCAQVWMFTQVWVRASERTRTTWPG